MDKTNFTQMFLREKKAQRSIEKLSKKLNPFVTDATNLTVAKIDLDMAQVMVVYLARRYHMDTNILAVSEQPLTEMFYTILAYGYAMALLDANVKGEANGNDN